MKKRTPPLRISRNRNSSPRNAIATRDLSRWLDSWLLSCDIERHSERTIGNRRERVSRLIWFLEQKGHEVCGLNELRGFFHYLNNGHKEPGGRWGNARDPHCKKPLSSGSVKSFHSSLRTFFNWLVAEQELEKSPMERIGVPVDRPDQIQPFTEGHIQALLRAAGKGKNPKRDEALLLLMLDTGLRVTEVCSLTIGDVDFAGYQIAVREGKGGKARFVPFSPKVKRAIYVYLNERGDGFEDKTLPLFAADRGTGTGGALTRRGVGLLYGRLEKVAEVEGVRCSPHTMRHTFAISFLRNGGNVFTLKTLLGHEALAMVNRYVALSQADVTRQHAQYSPVAQLKGGKRR